MLLAYDITRLATRLLNLTPNGIDRIDFALAKHSLAGSNQFGVLATGLGPRLFAADAARRAIETIGAHWGEDLDPNEDPAYGNVLTRLAGRKTAGAPEKARRLRHGRSGRLARAGRWLAEYGVPIGRSLKTDLPPCARYLNVSQFPIWSRAYLEWLESRRDVKAVFFIHDLLPIEMPEYFRAGEYERHRRRLANVARFGAAALVTSEVVKAGLDDYLRGLGRTDLPILVAPIPCAPIFGTPGSLEPALAAAPYFVCCGTIEPRKNHLILLHVWRELVRRDGEAAPKLVLVGTRGWKYRAVVDLLERSPAICSHVIEVAGLTSPALKRLIDGACALLMPSFGEGYGLPVREALAAGTPVIASNIPAFHDIEDERLALLSPIDGEAWLAAIRRLAGGRSACGRNIHLNARAATWSAYLDRIDAFIAAL